MKSKLTDPPATIEGDEFIKSDADSDSDDDVEVPKTNELVSAYVENPCYVCHKCFASPYSLRGHMKTFHGITLPGRPISFGRPKSVRYRFVSQKSQYHRRTLFGCPSCWFHCKQDYQRIGTHISEAHLDEDGTGYEEPEDEEGDFSGDEDDMTFKDSTSTANYMINQLDELSAKFKNLFGF